MRRASVVNNLRRITTVVFFKNPTRSADSHSLRAKWVGEFPHKLQNGDESVAVRPRVSHCNSRLVIRVDYLPKRSQPPYALIYDSLLCLGSQLRARKCLQPTDGPSNGPVSVAENYVSCCKPTGSRDI